MHAIDISLGLGNPLCTIYLLSSSATPYTQQSFINEFTNKELYGMIGQSGDTLSIVEIYYDSDEQKLNVNFPQANYSIFVDDATLFNDVSPVLL